VARQALEIEISTEMLEEGITRAREQEQIYGHNTGHFTLESEKENTIIGTVGEIVAREVINECRSARNIGLSIQLSDLGAHTDLVIHNHELFNGLHIKTGLWRRWPRDDFSFGVHADQGIQHASEPLVLVSLLKESEEFPVKAQVEGFVTPDYLRRCQVIHRGDRFPGSGVVSRTSNIVTFFRDYNPIADLF